MSFALLFAILMILWGLSIIGAMSGWNSPWFINGGTVLQWILFALLGYKIFGPLLYAQYKHKQMFDVKFPFVDFQTLICKAEEKYFNKLNYIIRKLEEMSIELDNLTAQVKANNDLLDSATTLINGIADRITAAGVDPNKLASLTAELKAKDDVLAAAVTANTPKA